MGRHKQIECRICLKTMTSDHLKQHMKTHEKKTNGIEEAGSSRSGVCDKLGTHKQLHVKFV